MGTTTPDLVFPSTACLIQKRLGLPDCGAMDVNAACSGFIYALSVADKFIRCGDARKALVCGSETLSKITNWKKRETAVLFGDGAGAVVLEASEEPGILSTHVHANGDYEDLLYANVGVSRGWEGMKDNEGRPEIAMRGNEVFKVAVRTLGRIVKETLGANNLDKSDLDWLIPHQANLRINEAAQKVLRLPDEKVHNNIQKYGNTTSATLPICYHEARQQGRGGEGSLVAFTALGAGLHWGAVLLRV